MWKAIFAGTTALTIAGATLAIAQQVPDRDSSQRLRSSAEDRSVFTDAQLAELKAGLRLTPSQEKYWPEFEAVLRERAKQRAAEQKRLADVLEPLYNSLDESQQQRFAMLFRAEGEGRSTFRSRDRDQMGRDRQMNRDPQGPNRERSSRSQQQLDDDQMGPDRQMNRDPRGPNRERSSRSQQQLDDDQMGPDRQMNRDPRGPNRERSSRSQQQLDDDQMGPDRQMNRDPRGPNRERSFLSQRRMDNDQIGADRQARRGPQGLYREGPVRSQ